MVIIFVALSLYRPARQPVDGRTDLYVEGDVLGDVAQLEDDDWKADSERHQRVTWTRDERRPDTDEQSSSSHYTPPRLPDVVALPWEIQKGHFQQYYSYMQTHTHPFNGPFSGTTQVSRCQKGKTDLDFTEARDSERRWHQLGRMHVCTLLQTDNHTSTPPLKFFYRPDALPATQPTASKH